MIHCPNFKDEEHRLVCECGEERRDGGYNGWENRETWAVALHLGNTQTLDGMTRAAYGIGIIKARQAARNLGDTEVSERLASSYAGEAIRDMVTEWFELIYYPEDQDALYATSNRFLGDVRGMASDVGSLWRVDWHAVANAFSPEEGLPEGETIASYINSYGDGEADQSALTGGHFEVKG